MDYFVISIQKIGTTNIQSIYAYNTKEEALSVYHNTLASNYASTTLDFFSVIVLNQYGITEVMEYWERKNIE